MFNRNSLAISLIAFCSAFLVNHVVFADDFDDLPNVEQYVQDESTAMGSVARTEQKLGYMGDIDDVRWQLYKCISLDVGAGVIRGGLNCEDSSSSGGSVEVSEEYKKLQETFSGTECKQNSNWEKYTKDITGSAKTAGSVSCSSLSSAYCSASNKSKAEGNLSTYYDCYRNGEKISCLELAETYCSLTGTGTKDEEGDSDSSSDSGGSSSGITDEEKAAAIQKEKEDKGKDAVSNSSKRKCVLNGVEVDCKKLAEANEIRKKTGNEASYDSESTECSAEIVCKGSEGQTVGCKKARDVIQCGKSSSEGLSIQYSCFVGSETVDCSLLGEGECTQDVCNEMCPEYGGTVVKNTCSCYNLPAVCAGVCEYGAIISENSRSIATVEVTNGGSGYTDRGVLSKEGLNLSYTITAQSSSPKVKATIYDDGGSGSGAAGEVVYTVEKTSISTTIKVTGINITSTGSGYTYPKATINVSVGKNTKAWGVSLDVSSYPTVTVTDTTGTGAELKAIINNGKVTAIQVVKGGSYYVDPVITISSNGGTGAEAKVSLITDCVCKEKPNCDALCEFSGVPVGKGTQDCDCYTKPNCNDTSHCLYGGYPSVKANDSEYVCTTATCAYGYLTDDNPNKCDATICPYGTK